MKFQKIKEKLPLFEDVAELSMEYVKENEFITRLPRRLMSYFPLFDVDSLNVNPITDVLKLEKNFDDNLSYVGVDTSIVPLAESVKGILYAMRGAAVKYLPRTGEYTIKIFGPTLLYYTPETAKFFHKYVRLGLNSLASSIYDTYIAKKILVTIYELNILMELIDSRFSDIIIVDGSIESPIVRKSIYQDIINSLHEKSIGIIGVSKRSRLIKRFFELMVFLKKYDVDGFIEIKRNNLISRTYLGYFNVRSGMPFRVDITTNLSPTILNNIYSLPSNGFGYPSILVEAHTISKLKYRDVLGLYGVILDMGGSIKSSISHRSALIGPLEGGGNEAF